MFARSLIAYALLAIVVAGCVAVSDTEPHLVAYLVRHAEKATGPDPALTETGHSRALALVDAMRRTEINTVLSSDFRRTRDTASPVAGAMNLDVELYDPRDLVSLAATLKATGGRVLVVGHSNTTPELVGLLGGEPGTAIDEATEYDRLYVVTMFENGDVKTELRRYGGG